MRHSTLTIALTSALALSLAACATKPKAVPVAEAPAPVAPPQGGDDYTPPSLDQGPVAQSLQQNLAATAGDRVFFALDSYQLTAEARDILAAQAQWLAQHPTMRVMIAGNCDERGTREYNFALGARRAASARDFLVAQGVSSGRLATVSYGKEKPIDAGSDDTAWSRNRNAGTVIIDLAPQ